MKDHFELLLATEPAAKLKASDANKLVKQVNKVLLALLKASPLEAARSLPNDVRKTLAGRLDVSFTHSELKALSRVWEPRRRIEDGESQTDLGGNLTSLMNGEREPYTPIDSRLTLKGARERSSQDRSEMIEKIRDWAPSADLKRLAKKWDGHHASLQSASREKKVAHLIELIEGRAEPQPKPPKR